MEYKRHKQKPVGVAKNQQPVDVQEYSTSKVYKLGEIPTKRTAKEEAKRGLKFTKFKNIRFKPLKKIIELQKHFAQLIKTSYINSSKRQKIIVFSVLAVLVAIFAGFALIKGGADSKDKSPEIAGKSNIRLSFTPITAPGKTLVVEPEGKRDTGSYSDKIDDINIRVSEQALPSDFKPDTKEKLASFAKANYYNEQIDVGVVKVYTGMSIKGVESVVFVKNDLLIFIKAEQKLDKNSLTNYIKSLR